MKKEKLDFKMMLVGTFYDNDKGGDKEVSKEISEILDYFKERLNKADFEKLLRLDSLFNHSSTCEVERFLDFLIDFFHFWVG